MKHIVSIGGGISSTLVLPLWASCNIPKKDIDLVMARLPNEDADVWRLVEAVEDMVGIPVKFIGDNLTPWDVFYKVGAINPVINNSRGDPCSFHLKREVMRQYVQSRYAPGEATVHVGIGAYEIDRELAIRKAWGARGYEVKMPLIEMSGMDRAWMMHYCKIMTGFVPLLYTLDFEHNNCGGACIKAGHTQWAKLWWYSKQGLLKTHEGIPTFDWWRDNEAALCRKLGKTIAILRHWRKPNKGKPLPLAEFEKQLQLKIGGFLPGFAPTMMKWQEFEQALIEDGAEATAGCSFCEAAA